MPNYKQATKDKILKIYGHEPTSLDDLAHCVIAMVNTFKGRSEKSTKITGFSWQISYDQKVRNTHNCPINGETNWGNEKPNAPKGYPGWSGRVWIRYVKYPDSFGSDTFESSLTYPGTGGGGEYDGPFKRKDGGYICSWDYHFFSDDWPLINDGLMMLDILENNKLTRTYKHNFLWEDAKLLKTKG